MHNINFANFILSSSFSNDPENEELVFTKDKQLIRQKIVDSNNIGELCERTQERRNVWNAFQRAILNEFGEARIQSICTRYTIDLKQIIKAADEELDRRPVCERFLNAVCWKFGSERVQKLCLAYNIEWALLNHRVYYSENRRAFDLFQRMIIREFGKGEIIQLCDQHHIDLRQITREVPALLPRFIDAFGVGLANLNVSQLQSVLGTHKKIEECTPRELEALKIRAYPHGYFGERKKPQELFGGPIELSEYLKYDPIIQDQKRLNLYEGIEKLKEPHAFLQRLVMAIVHHDMEIGDIVDAPGENGGKDFYKLHKVVKAGGLYAMVLVPISRHSVLKPILAFRPTGSSLNAIDVLDTWRNNFETENGLRGYLAAKPELDELWNDPLFYNPDFGIFPIVSAYSLGGAFAGYFVKDHLIVPGTQKVKIKEVVCFNTVSNSTREIADTIKNELNRWDPNTLGPAFYIYWNLSEESQERDIATLLGNRHIGYGITHVGTLVQLTLVSTPCPPPTDLARWFDLHTLRFFDSKEGVKYPTRVVPRTEIDYYLNNELRGEEVRRFELQRVKLGRDFLGTLVDFLEEILQLFFRILNLKILRTSREH